MENTKILLLEGIHQVAVDQLKKAGYTNIELLPKSLPENELIEKIKDVNFIGIRSRTQLNKKVLAAAKNLRAIACFCIGTNQVDLIEAQKLGIPVFNAPFSNTRSVAEIAIASTIHLMRGTFEKSTVAHRGGWMKSAENSYEVRTKKMGIVGYGNIGAQLSVIASALGMHVYYYDVENKLAHGNARAVDTLEELLAISDVVTLHVPETPQTKNMMNKETFAQMKDGSFFINYARGTVVDIDALAEAMDSGKVLGAAIDVFPKEPKSKEEEFESPLRGRDNVIITPHVGGSTLEAQVNIGNEVAEKIRKYDQEGTTQWSVNFPEVQLPVQANTHRILHIHQNRPGVMTRINEILSSHEVNVAGQYLQTKENTGYVVIDTDGNLTDEIRNELKAIEGTLTVRFLK